MLLVRDSMWLSWKNLFTVSPNQPLHPTSGGTGLEQVVRIVNTARG